MSLPAGFSITSVDGRRCTAVPRSATTLPASLATLPAATPSITSTSSTTISTPSASNAQPNLTGQSSSLPPTTGAATSIVSTPVASFVTSTSAAVLSTSAKSAISSASAIPASRKTTPATSSSTAVAITQSEVRGSVVSASPTTLSGNNNGNGFVNPSKTTPTSSTSSLASTARPEESSASSGISSNPQLTAAPVVGGVVGSVVLIAIVALVFFLIRKRKKGRESLLNLTTGRRSSFYGADNRSFGPSGRGIRWKSEVAYQADKLRSFGSGIKAGIVGLGASLKSKVGGDRSDTPNVNLDRGNSQFLDGSIPQHSRNNSALSDTEKPSIKDRASDWWERFIEKVGFAWRMRMKTKEPEDPFAAARSMSEKQAAKMNNPPDFSQLLRMDDRDLQLEAERRRISLAGNTNSLPQLGSLGLNFGSPSDDPFADPTASNDPARNPFADPATSRTNPFADPPTRPEATIPKANTYITDIRRSRGQSIDANTSSNKLTSMYRPPSIVAGSRYPSTIAPSRDSYRDTVFSSFSANVRKGKGRSDPFDLERPELWRPKDSGEAMYHAALNTKAGTVGQYTGSNLRVISTGSLLSKSSSSVSLGEWGDPGPDLGPRSSSSSLRGNASSNGSGDFSAAARGFYGEGVTGGGARENWDKTREQDNVNRISRTSSKGGVGKAI